MALVKLGAIVTSLSGKVGGMSFVNTKNGTVLRTTGNKIKVVTEKNSKTVTSFSAVASGWKTLSASQRDTWKVATINFPYINRVGNTSYLNAFQLFMQHNLNLKLIGASPIAVAPAPAILTPFSGLALTSTPTTLILQTAGGSAAMSYVVNFAPPLSNSSNYAQKHFRYFKTLSMVQLNSGYDFATLYVQEFGIPITGMRGVCQIVTIDNTTGQALKAKLVTSTTFN